MPSAIQLLEAELTDLLGSQAVTVDLVKRQKASMDGSYLSPIIQAQMPLGTADLVAYPASTEQIAATVAAAARHGVAVTPRGKGTSNYGQSIPMKAGLVIDMTRAKAIVEVGDGFVTSEPGATMVSLEQAANKAGQQLLIYPSTVQSSIGGFLAGGSGGTGSIKHGMVHTGYALALEVVHATGDPALVHLEGAATEPYIHNYGTAGIIARATIALEPLQDWWGFFASFDDFHDAISLLGPLADLTPTPRLVSVDPPLLADALPSDPGIARGRSSLRAILDVASLEEATSLVNAASGRVEACREGPQTCLKLSRMSYNHPIEWLQRAYPGKYFHVEVSGDLVATVDELVQVYPGGMLHLEAQRGRPIGMLVGAFESPAEVYAGFERLARMGIGYHNPHQWYVDYRRSETAALAATTDPQGILNPGKLVEPLVATGSQR